MTKLADGSTVIVLPGGKLAYSIEELPLVAPFSKDTFYRALRKPRDDGEFPPPLVGHRDSKKRGVVLATDFQAWLELLPDY